MEKVATQNFNVPLTEVPIMYSGGFTSVTLPKPAYAPGENIRMIVKVWAQRSANWLDLIWHTTIRAFTTAGVKLTEVSATHLAIPGVDDYETYDVDLDLGTQPPQGLSGYLELWCDGSPEVKVATYKFGVPGGTGGEGMSMIPVVVGVAAGAGLLLLLAAGKKK